MADKSMEGLNTFTDQTEEKVDATKKLRIGFIGTGGIANSHIKAYLNQPDVEIVAGCDLVPGRAKAFFEKYELEGVKTDYKDHEEMLADKSLRLDAVSICTYNCQHKITAIAALDAGINVLLEKPFTVTTEEAVEIMKAEKRSGKVLSIGFQPRFDGNMQMIGKIVRSGVLGKIYYIQTGGGRRRGIPCNETKDSFIRSDTAGIGALGDIGCYSLDMVLNALGYPKPRTVTGMKSAYFGKDPNYCRYTEIGRPDFAERFGVDDFAAGFIRLEPGEYGADEGIILDFRISWAMNINTPGDTIILGTKGGLRIPSTDCWNGTVGGPMTVYTEAAGQQVSYEVPIIEKRALVDLKVRSFLDACKNGTSAPVPSSQIIINQAIISGIARSAELGHEIEIEIPEV
ncbi:MAG: Gfo/Idh/MocA family oxidoreductase [Clostridia bacterium]|nr:Gfo/Idh/MocA family oxidoreductase [Clostridia bacterium]